LVELSSITAKTFFLFVDIGVIVDHKPKESFNSDDQQFIQYQQTKRKLEQ
jgi:hypothetical protein